MTMQYIRKAKLLVGQPGNPAKIGEPGSGKQLTVNGTAYPVAADGSVTIPGSVYDALPDTEDLRRAERASSGALVDAPDTIPAEFFQRGRLGRRRRRRIGATQEVLDSDSITSQYRWTQTFLTR